MPTFDIYDEADGGTLVHSEHLPDPVLDPDTIIAAVDVMTDEQKAALRAALGL